jgi:nitric oxide reductase large subunit
LLRETGPRELRYFPIVEIATCWGVSSISREYTAAIKSIFPEYTAVWTKISEVSSVISKFIPGINDSSDLDPV